MNTAPLVSVLMPVYNAEKYVAEAIESILNQTYTNFEFLIFNDGSTDASAAIINRYHDNRIRLINAPENTGYVPHLNAGIDLAKGKYIARMDADDISIGTRLEKQVAFMEANPEVGLVGTAINTFDANGPVFTWFPEQTHEAVKCYMLFDTCFAHPSVMLRKEILLQHQLRYDATYMPAEDYKLWTDLVLITQAANLKEPLLNYRESVTQISQQKSHLQVGNANRVRREMLGHIGIEPTPEQLDFQAEILDGHWPPNKQFFSSVLEWFNFLIMSNRRTNFFEPEELGKTLSKLLYRHCLEHASIKFDAYTLFRKSDLYNYYQPSAADLLKLKFAPYYRFINFHYRANGLLIKQRLKKYLKT